MAEQVVKSLIVRELVLGDVSYFDTKTPRTGTIGLSGTSCIFFNGTIWVHLS